MSNTNYLICSKWPNAQNELLQKLAVARLAQPEVSHRTGYEGHSL